MKKILYFIMVSVGLLTSCDKGELVENTVYEKIEPSDPKYAYLKILNLTPGSPAVNFYMDGTKFSAGYSTLGVENAGFAYNGLFPDLGYAKTSPTTHTLTAKIIPSLPPDANLEVFSQDITPAAGKYYTIFTTGAYTTANKKIPSAIMLEDTRPVLDTTKIFVRLANIATGTANLDMVKDAATGPKITLNTANGSVSDWVEIPGLPAGTAPIVKFFFNNAGTNTTLISAGISPTLTKGRAYTIYLRGIVGNTATPLAATFYTTFY